MRPFDAPSAAAAISGADEPRPYIQSPLPPQMFCAYKEVLDLYRQGLEVPNDVTIVWPDDNFGYIRNFASPAERTRPGGFGVYYHISYLGRPLAYLWLNTTPPALIWSELTKAHAHGADRIWIVNVGDLKPAEIGTEFFLRLAWDVQQWGPDAQPVFLREWAVREFGPEHASAIAGLMDRYYRLNFARKPEHLQWWLPKEPPRASPISDTEIDTRLTGFGDLHAAADRIAATLPPARRDAFEQLVGYPVRGSALANARYFHGERGATDAAFAADAALRAITLRFNTQVAGGKWRGFMRLEPADDDWRSMRIAPWAPPKFNWQPVADSPPVVTRAAGAFDRKNDRPGAAWTVVASLGHTGEAVTILPFDAPSIVPAVAVTLAPSLEYDFTLPDAGEHVLQVHLLPTHPLVPGRGLRFAFALNDAAPQEIVVSIPDGSPAWAQGVLDNRITANVRLQALPAGSHGLKLFMVDAGVVLDSFTLTFAESTSGPDFP